MTAIVTITDDATYERASARASELMNNCATPAESAELRALAAAIGVYSRERFPMLYGPTDGPSEIEYLLDNGALMLEDVISVFGGLERFVEYMTRRRPLDAATLEALVAECGLDRVELEKAFCEEPGWDAISAEGQEPCGKPDCCLPREENWRIMLAEMLAEEQRDRQPERELAGVGVC